MSETVDELYLAILRISADIDALSDGHPNRKRLEAERRDLRTRATELAATGRHPVSVEREIESLEHRLKEIASMQITEGYQERRGGKNLQDPGAYSSTINRLLDEHHDQETAEIEERLTSLRDQQNDHPTEDGD